MNPKFILNRLKEKFEVSEEKQQEGFPEMNYLIGNSSAMDVGEVPTPMDERIGYAAQIGGSVMELQITNPATFTLERDEMISTIEQLGIDITLHSDMNAGYTTAYKTGAGESYGYDTVEQYFTEYLQELAAFKKEVERRGNGEPLFKVGRINPHISTSPLPSLSERMAQDIGLDPFGFEISNFNEDYFKSKSRKGRNIYDNSEFLRRFYRLFVVDEIGENEYRYFQNFYTSVSSKFDKAWRTKQNKVLNKMYHDRTEENGSELNDKIELLSTASTRENVTTEWLDILGSDEISGFEPIPNPLNNIQIKDRNMSFGPEKLENLEDLDRFISAISQRYRLSQLRTLPEIYYFIANEDLSRMASSQSRKFVEGAELGDFKSKLKEQFEAKMPEALDELWTRDPRDENERTKVSLISVQGKITAMVRELEIPDNWVQEKTFDEHKDDLRDEIEEMFAGEDPSYFQDEETDGDIDWEERHRRFLQSFGRNFEQQMWMESNLFYRIIPGWMDTSDDEFEGHDGWKAPKFIWETVIENKWNEKNNVDIDLKNPRKNGSDDKGYFNLLENNREFQMDVAAAVGACYAWAHYTQRKARFDLKGRDFGLSAEEREEVESEGWTWIRWMNRFGIGVNLETMQGSPQQKFKIWRPKDIAVTAHAINLTAENNLEELNPEIDGRPAKFTIDMEHVATMGAPPMDEMERFFDQEEMLLDDDRLEIDEEKPVAKILRQMHLMDPGVEGQRGTHHGAFDRGNKQLYEWLYRFVEKGFARNEVEPATVLFELAEHKGESSYMMRITMNMIEMGIEPDEVTPDNVDPSKEEYRDEKEALIARFFGMDRASYSKEWAKIEEHAFDPLEGLLEAEQFDYTYSSVASLESDNNPRDYAGEEYK